MLRQFELHRLQRRGGAMLDGEREVPAVVAAQIEIAVIPGVELGRATQGLAGARIAGAFAGVMDDEYGCTVPALQFTQIGEDGRHFATGILVDVTRFALCGDGEQLAGNGHQSARIALRMVRERCDQFGCHQLNGAGFLQGMQEQLGQFVRRRSFQCKPHAHAAIERQKFFGMRRVTDLPTPGAPVMRAKPPLPPSCSARQQNCS